jgi:hypothetical protein
MRYAKGMDYYYTNDNCWLLENYIFSRKINFKAQTGIYYFIVRKVLRYHRDTLRL